MGELWESGSVNGSQGSTRKASGRCKRHGGTDPSQVSNVTLFPTVDLC